MNIIKGETGIFGSRIIILHSEIRCYRKKQEKAND